MIQMLTTFTARTASMAPTTCLSCAVTVPNIKAIKAAKKHQRLYKGHYKSMHIVKSVWEMRQGALDRALVHRCKGVKGDEHSRSQ